jgi:probable HAF family extracellular repeat protein
MIDLGTLPGGVNSFASDINERGQIVGGGDNGSLSFAVIWQNGVMTQLERLGGTGNTIALSINNRGQMTGQASTENDEASHAVIWTK